MLDFIKTADYEEFKYKCSNDSENTEILVLCCLRKSLVRYSKGESVLVNVINGLSPDINLMSANEEMAVKCILFYFLRLLTTFPSCCFTRERFAYST